VGSSRAAFALWSSSTLSASAQLSALMSIVWWAAKSTSGFLGKSVKGELFDAALGSFALQLIGTARQVGHAVEPAAQGSRGMMMFPEVRVYTCVAAAPLRASSPAQLSAASTISVVGSASAAMHLTASHCARSRELEAEPPALSSSFALYSDTAQRARGQSSAGPEGGEVAVLDATPRTIEDESQLQPRRQEALLSARPPSEICEH